MWDDWPVWFDVASRVIAIASIVAAATPWPHDDSAVLWARRLLDAAALNIGHARHERRQ